MPRSDLLSSWGTQRQAMAEFPKWLHKDWKATEKAPGHHVAGASKLVHTAEDALELLEKGWTEDAPQPAKKEAPKPEEPKAPAKKEALKEK